MPRLRRAGRVRLEADGARRRAGAALAFVWLFLGLAGAAPAFAQSPAQPAMPPHMPPGKFDFFVLALSWSPGFCAATDNAKTSSECAAGTALGFVVHGLWPQFEHGFPSHCTAAPRNPPRAALAKAAGLFPDEGLARYEWRTHGACTGEAPADYFADVRRARDEIAVPAGFQSPMAAQKLAPAAIQRAFLDANPRLRPGMLAIVCRRAILEEVRFCLTKDLRGFRPCPEIVRASCRTPQIGVPPPR